MTFRTLSSVAASFLIAVACLLSDAGLAASGLVQMGNLQSKTTLQGSLNLKDLGYKWSKNFSITGGEKQLAFSWGTSEPGATEAVWEVRDKSGTKLLQSGNPGAMAKAGSEKVFLVDFTKMPVEDVYHVRVVVRNAAHKALGLPSNVVVVTRAAKQKPVVFTDPGLQVPIDDIVEEVRKKYNLPALGGAVVTAAMGVEAIAASGIRMDGNKTKVTDADRWHLGSNTKAMTATLVGVLIDKKTPNLKWSTTIADVFPEWSSSMDQFFKTVTIDRLMAQKAGVPATQSAAATTALSDASKSSVTDRRKEHAKLVVTAAPRENPDKWMYSNSNFIIVGAMLEKLTKRSWEDLVQKELFDPLGMAATGFGAPGGGPTVLDQPLGHRDTASGRMSSYSDNPVAIGPAGTVHATMRDFARFLRLHLGVKVGSLKLSKETLAYLHSADKEKDKKYAAGWGQFAADWTKELVLTHNGSNTNWYSNAVVAPGSGFAVLTVCNFGTPDLEGAPRKAADELSQKLIDRQVK